MFQCSLSLIEMSFNFSQKPNWIKIPPLPMEVSTLLKQMRCCMGNVYRDATDITKVTLQVYEKLIIKASTPK